MNIKEFDLKISKIIEETYDTKTYRINLDGNELNFEPGQFVSLILDFPKDGKTEKISRSYSISSSPLKKEYIDLTIKKTNNGGVADYIVDNLKIDDKIKIKGPYGVFIFKDEIKKVVFIAGGSGISSLMSMIRYDIDKKLDTNLTLLFSNKTPEDIIFRKELEELKNKGIKIVDTLTRYDKEDWDGEKGRINQEMIKKYVDLDSIFYICGLPQMVDDVKKELEALGVDKTKIKIEKY
ncbi:MAG: FAD-binding oxidoreductase [Candidatus Nanoarchaeia archaeon]|jgi:ferredoxin-NADP reductase|nr:FAD-binding oxidoreductase [Candidatus Nanoarchaeia archaeon]|tara:strand:+ start:11462 stop:12172 length:711 start_codon:yes stop_codon:yes gene_type:complete